MTTVSETEIARALGTALRNALKPPQESLEVALRGPIKPPPARVVLVPECVRVVRAALDQRRILGVATEPLPDGQEWQAELVDHPDAGRLLLVNDVTLCCVYDAGFRDRQGPERWSRAERYFGDLKRAGAIFEGTVTTKLATPVVALRVEVIAPQR